MVLLIVHGNFEAAKVQVAVLSGYYTESTHVSSISLLIIGESVFAA
jgi:hypothetical protein